jgi:hypothetical protein
MGRGGGEVCRVVGCGRREREKVRGTARKTKGESEGEVHQPVRFSVTNYSVCPLLRTRSVN